MSRARLDGDPRLLEVLQQRRHNIPIQPQPRDGIDSSTADEHGDLGAELGEDLGVLDGDDPGARDDLARKAVSGMLWGW